MSEQPDEPYEPCGQNAVVFGVMVTCLRRAGHDLSEGPTAWHQGDLGEGQYSWPPQAASE